MIYVTQGHERGIGLEIFLKSFLTLSTVQKRAISLVVNARDFDSNLNASKLTKAQFKELNLIHVDDDVNLPASTTTLLHVLKVIKEDDILITLPTSKDQLILNGKNMAGYTEFFRNFYNNPNISMTFKGISQDVLLITDHLALKDVSKTITKKLIIEKTLTTLNFFKKYFYNFEEVIFSGINPHVGENGLLGTEDKCIGEAISVLKKTESLIFTGPLSGDTLHMAQNSTRRQLFVYMYHDQGLAPFKSHYGLIGLNISMGLPFLRLSVDHGTAFHLHGKNEANITGMMFLLKKSFEVTSYVN
jgi:4-hydroxythreonine-4-phosphate dehydrogenase